MVSFRALKIRYYRIRMRFRDGVCIGKGEVVGACLLKHVAAKTCPQSRQKAYRQVCGVTSGLELGVQLEIGLGDGYSNRSQLDYSVTYCDIRRSAIRFLPATQIRSFERQNSNRKLLKKQSCSSRAVMVPTTLQKNSFPLILAQNERFSLTNRVFSWTH